MSFGLVLRHSDEDPELRNKKRKKKEMEKEIMRLRISIMQSESLRQLQKDNKVSLTEKEKSERQTAEELVLRKTKLVLDLGRAIASLDFQYQRVGMFSSIRNNHFATAESKIFTIM
jgi:hypothetical protein